MWFDRRSGVFIFFFFKQKTAYDMRISDWSSDVCSSDLQTFSPDRLKREFIIAGSDIAHLVVLTALHSAARFEAPHTSYRALTLSGDEMVSALETGHVDIAVGAYPSLVAGIKTQRLYQEEYLCFGDRKSTRLNSSH